MGRGEEQDSRWIPSLLGSRERVGSLVRGGMVALEGERSEEVSRGRGLEWKDREGR